MRIYLSGRITGREKKDYQAQFGAVAERLRKIGHDVVNPACHDFDLDYWDYMRVDLMLLEMCDAVYMLRGWEESMGAKIEKGYAEHLGKEIIYERIPDC